MMAKASAKQAAPQPEPQAIDLQDILSLENLKPAPGSIKRRVRVGRGRATGVGKTSGRGHNGEGQRSGNSSKRGFEGGQMPLYRRIPKFRSFPNPNKKNWLEINVGKLEDLLEDGQSQLTYQTLSQYRMWKRQTDGLRILGNGEIKKAIQIQAHYVSPSAKAKIEAAGGKVELLEGPAHNFIQ